MASISSKDQALAGQSEALPALFAGGVSAALLLGALAFQYLGGLAPCEMCIWQRRHVFSLLLQTPDATQVKRVNSHAVSAGVNRVPRDLNFRCR